MNEPGWLTFYTAAREIEQRFGGSQAEAQAKLRQACRDEKIRAMRAPYDGQGEGPDQLPIEFWTRVAPREWRERDVDFDGPDDDGCPIEIMLNENDFRHWLDRQRPDDPLAKREAAIIKWLSKKPRPAWKQFCDGVRKDCDETSSTRGFSDETIENVARKMLNRQSP